MLDENKLSGSPGSPGRPGQNTKQVRFAIDQEQGTNAGPPIGMQDYRLPLSSALDNRQNNALYVQSQFIPGNNQYSKNYLQRWPRSIEVSSNATNSTSRSKKVIVNYIEIDLMDHRWIQVNIM